MLLFPLWAVLRIVAVVSTESWRAIVAQADNNRTKVGSGHITDCASIGLCIHRVFASIGSIVLVADLKCSNPEQFQVSRHLPFSAQVSGRTIQPSPSAPSSASTAAPSTGICSSSPTNNIAIVVVVAAAVVEVLHRIVVGVDNGDDRRAVILLHNINSHQYGLFIIKWWFGRLLRVEFQNFVKEFCKNQNLFAFPIDEELVLRGNPASKNKLWWLFDW